MVVQFHSSLYFLKKIICQVNNHALYVLCNVFRTDWSGQNFAYCSDSQLNFVKWLHFDSQTNVATTINRSWGDNCHVVAIMVILFYIRTLFLMFWHDALVCFWRRVYQIIIHIISRDRKLHMYTAWKWVAEAFGLRLPSFIFLPQIITMGRNLLHYFRMSSFKCST